jgi:hypothetical protein
LETNAGTGILSSNKKPRGATKACPERPSSEHFNARSQSPELFLSPLDLADYAAPANDEKSIKKPGRWLIALKN